MTHDASEALFEGETRVAQSAGYLDAWDAPIRRAIEAIGEKDAFFVVFVSKTHVAIGSGDRRRCYCRLIRNSTYSLYPDPFAIADAIPPKWDGRGYHDDLPWPITTVPRRDVAALQTLLKEKESPLLLGATQAIVDGSRIALDASQTAKDLIADLWKLLPTSIQRRVSFATNSRPTPLFDIIRCEAADLPAAGFLTIEQVLDYPESRYEHTLQYAIESGNQTLLDGLFARRAGSDVLRSLAIALMLTLGIAIALKLISR